MEKKYSPIKKEEIVFPEEITLLIQEILKKHGLYKTHEKGVIRLLKSQDPKEKKEIFERLPGYVVSKFVKEFAEGRVTSEELLPLLKENLDLPANGVKELAKDIAENILVFIKPIKKKKIPPSPPKAEPSTIPAKKPSEAKKDIYREPLE